MTFDVLAPAKINLGLEVIGKRDDGFHDIATVFQTISLFDRLRFTPSTNHTVRILDQEEQIDGNLVNRALTLAQSVDDTNQGWQVDIEKRIPMAAGLGGASADAAATLQLLVATGSLSPLQLPNLALTLGSDVPFLLHGGAALAHGRGEILDHLPTLRGVWLVLATPSIAIERKTARLYGALQRNDFTDGSRTERVAEALRQGQFPTVTDLGNAFERPLAALVPEISSLRETFMRAGAPFVALSGAGPTHYTFVPDLGDAITLAARISHNVNDPLRTFIARPTATGPLLRGEKTIASCEAL